MEAHLPHQTQEQQQAVVELWASSGLTQAEFCRRENIPPTFDLGAPENSSR
jgi:hypothetical protein